MNKINILTSSGAGSCRRCVGGRNWIIGGYSCDSITFDNVASFYLQFCQFLPQLVPFFFSFFLSIMQTQICKKRDTQTLYSLFQILSFRVISSLYSNKIALIYYRRKFIIYLKRI